jgi:hypothetical protein
MKMKSVRELLLGPMCRLCARHSRGLLSLGDVTKTEAAPLEVTEYRLLHCPRCEVVYLDPLPSAKDLATLYQQTVQFSDIVYTDPDRIEKVLEYCGNSLSTFALLPPPGGQMLEVGAGLAWMSRVAKSVRSDLKTVAQDLSNECEQQCPWVDRYFVGALDALSERGPYHLISLTHVIEHVPDPAATLVEVANLLARGGKVFITAPYRPTGWKPSAGLAGWREYSYLHVPAHISYLSKPWFELAAKSTGLRLEHWDQHQDGGQAFEVVLSKA